MAIRNPMARGKRERERARAEKQKEKAARRAEARARRGQGPGGQAVKTPTSPASCRARRPIPGAMNLTRPTTPPKKTPRASDDPPPHGATLQRGPHASEERDA